MKKRKEGEKEGKSETNNVSSFPLLRAGELPSISESNEVQHETSFFTGNLRHRKSHTRKYAS